MLVALCGILLIVVCQEGAEGSSALYRRRAVVQSRPSHPLFQRRRRDAPAPGPSAPAAGHRGELSPAVRPRSDRLPRHPSRPTRPSDGPRRHRLHRPDTGQGQRTHRLILYHAMLHRSSNFYSSRPSVRLSVTLRYRGHTGWNTFKIILRLIIRLSSPGRPQSHRSTPRETPRKFLTGIGVTRHRVVTYL